MREMCKNGLEMSGTRGFTVLDMLRTMTVVNIWLYRVNFITRIKDFKQKTSRIQLSIYIESGIKVVFNTTFNAIIAAFKIYYFSLTYCIPFCFILYLPYS